MLSSASSINFFLLADNITILSENSGLSAIPSEELSEICKNTGEITSAYELLDITLASAFENIIPVKQTNNVMRSYFPTANSRN